MSSVSLQILQKTVLDQNEHPMEEDEGDDPVFLYEEKAFDADSVSMFLRSSVAQMVDLMDEAERQRQAEAAEERQQVLAAEAERLRMERLGLEPEWKLAIKKRQLLEEAGTKRDQKRKQKRTRPAMKEAKETKRRKEMRNKENIETCNDTDDAGETLTQDLLEMLQNSKYCRHEETKQQSKEPQQGAGNKTKAKNTKRRVATKAKCPVPRKQRKTPHSRPATNRARGRQSPNAQWFEENF